MSVQAMSWALSQQVVTAAPARHVLLCLANYADQDGKAAFPSAKTLAKDTGLGERTVRYKLDELETAGVIVRGNQKIAAAYIDRSDRRPVCYDIVMERGAGDAGREERGAAHDTTGCSSDANGVQLMQERGAGDAPNPSFKPSSNPSFNHKAKKTSSTVMPDNFEPNENNLLTAEKLKVNLDEELASFKDHHDAKGSKFVDWNKALNTWLRNAAKWAKPSNVHAFPGKPRPVHTQLDQASDNGLRQRADGAYSL